MDDAEFTQACAELGVDPANVTAETLQRVFLKYSYARIKEGIAEAERERLRCRHAAMLAHLARTTPPTAAPASVRPAVTDCAVSVNQPPPAPTTLFDPTSFDSALVNATAPVAVAGLALVINLTPFSFFLQGFHIWIHEFGHATIAWLTGKRALPLPIGWTNTEFERSLFVYFGVLFLLGLLFVASFRERKIWPMIFAVALASLQFYMTWRLPEETARMWMAFAGIGGEFYLSAAMMALFYVQFPEKFKWGVCRYVFLFLGASSFGMSYFFWRDVRHGAVPLPYGSMVNGEEDSSGDLDTLAGDFGWHDREIIATYHHLASACLIVLAVVYVAFALRLDKLPRAIVSRLWPSA
jgi:hypothetical protein